MKSEPVKVLIVDDSAYIRKVFSNMLSQKPGIVVVGAARDGFDALEKVDELNPDVIVLDVIMPRMDGLGFLHELMRRRPLPVVICSSAGEDEEMIIAAMQAGAIEFIHKPTARANQQVLTLADEMAEKIQVAAEAPIYRLHPAPSAPSSVVTREEITFEKTRGRIEGIVIGVSTGGPQALRDLLPRLPANFPVPIAVVLHMPEGYTGPFANRLNEISLIEVLEASEGLAMEPGRAILAKAGYHLVLVKAQKRSIICHLDNNIWRDTSHRPSVDVLFRSASNVYGAHTLGIVLTGMGHDGSEGAAWIKKQGGLIFAEAEETSIVFGMPRAVIEAGLSDKIIPLNRMIEGILESL